MTNSPSIDEAGLRADPAVVETWVRGWVLNRGTPPPVWDHGGLRVEVGLPQQRRRYVFAGVSDELRRLADAIHEPWVLLKVAGATEELRPMLAPRWEIQPVAAMMTVTLRAAAAPAPPPGYATAIERTASLAVVRMLAPNGEPAAKGTIALVDDSAIFDQIVTEDAHQRRGLGGVVMRTLEAEALARGAARGVLVATAQGRALYATLGWAVHCLYTTALIPGPEAAP